MATKEEYEYLLPDHWLLKPDSIWTLMHNDYVDRVVSIIRNDGAKTVIEVGCGDGFNCGRMVDAGLSVTGIDWSKNGIEHARRLVPNAIFHCGDIRDPAFMEVNEGRFDAVAFIEVLEHIAPDDCVPCLRNLTKLLRSGGLLVLTTPSTNKPNTNPQHYRHFDEASLRDLVHETGGLCVEELEGYGDVAAESRHYRLSRWIDNRYYTIKILRTMLLHRYQSLFLGRTPFDRCHGFIATIRKT